MLFSDFPPEIQSRCIWLAIKQSSVKTDGFPERYRTKAFQDIRYVCRDWNDILLSDSRYWSTIFIRESTNFVWIKTMIIRAGDKPLSIVIDNGEREGIVCANWLKKISHFGEPYLKFCEAITLHLSEKRVKIVLNCWKSTPAPMLRNIRLGIERQSLSTTAVPLDLSSIHLFSSASAKLKSVTVFPETTPLLLKAASLSDVEDLTLSVRSTFGGQDELDASILLLHQLKRLRLLSCSKPISFSTLLTFPNLTSVDVVHTTTVFAPLLNQNAVSQITFLKLTGVFDLQGNLGVLLDLLDELTILEDLRIAPRMWLLVPGVKLVPAHLLRTSGLQRLHTLDIEADDQCPSLPFLILTNFPFPLLETLAIRKDLAADYIPSTEMIPGISKILGRLKPTTFPKLTQLKLDFLEDSTLSAFLESSPNLEALSGMDVANPPHKFFELLLPRPLPDGTFHILCRRLRGLDFRFQDPDPIMFQSQYDRAKQYGEPIFEELFEKFNYMLGVAFGMRREFAAAGLCQALGPHAGPHWVHPEDS